MLDNFEVLELIKKQSDTMDWDYHSACYPINPLEIQAGDVTPEVIELLKKCKVICNSVRTYAGNWAGFSVCNSIMDSIRGSVEDSTYDSLRNSVWKSVWNFVCNSVCDSAWDSVVSYVRDSVWAEAGACFPNIKKWKGIDHEEGIYPFQCYCDLHALGFVPSFDGNTWKLHAGNDTKVVFEIKDAEL